MADDCHRRLLVLLVEAIHLIRAPPVAGQPATGGAIFHLIGSTRLFGPGFFCVCRKCNRDYKMCRSLTDYVELIVQTQTKAAIRDFCRTIDRNRLRLLRRTPDAIEVNH